MGPFGGGPACWPPQQPSHWRSGRSHACWALARLLGVELTGGKGHDASQVGAADVLVAGRVAGGVQTLIARRRAAGWWPFVGSAALSISIIGPTWLADGAASVVLIGMHFAVGLVLIVGFTRAGPVTRAT